MQKKNELENPDLKQKINFVGKYEGNGRAMFFIIEKS